MLTRTVQMVFQDPYASLHPRHTVDSTLSEPLAIHGERVEDGRVVQTLPGSRARPVVPVPLPAPALRRPAPEDRHRAGPDPATQILLLDEPTSALDASVQAEILNLLDELRRKLGLTYVLVSHDLAVVAHLCERLLVMRHGEAVEETTSAALRAQDAASDYTRSLIQASRGFTRREKPVPAAIP